MPTWMLIVEYDGAPFCGWQRQINGPSVQAELERALAEIHSGDATQTMGAGRTDAGVHARGQAVSFTTPRTLVINSYQRGLNRLLPDAIAVRGVTQVPENFDPRRWARGKRYVYRVLVSRYRSPLRAAQTWRMFMPLDVERMRAGAAHLLGTHDFSAFRAADCVARTTVRELRRLDVDRVGDEIVFTVEATAFLKHMVRNLVGTLVEVGHGRRTPDSIAELLASRDRTKAGRTAAPHGLCLDEVFYDLAAGAPEHVEISEDDA